MCAGDHAFAFPQNCQQRHAHLQPCYKMHILSNLHDTMNIKKTCVYIYIHTYIHLYVYTIYTETKYVIRLRNNNNDIPVVPHKAVAEVQSWKL